MSTLIGSVLQRVFVAVGTVATVYSALRFTRFLWLYNRPSGLHRYFKPNAWVLITGASDGIGKALCREFAANGFNVILHGRNPTKLDSVVKSISKDFPQRSFRTVIIDGSKYEDLDGNIKKAVESLNDLSGPLTVLVNNAGGNGNSTDYKPMHQVPTDVLNGIMTLNMRFPTMLTHALIPKLGADGPSIVVNVGSLAGTTGIPYFSVYSGTKAYNNHWNISLSRELRRGNLEIDVVGLLVGVVTGTVDIDVEETLFKPNTATFAKSVIRSIGCGRELLNPYWPHAMQYFFMGLLSEGLQEWFVNLNINQTMRKEMEKKRS